MASSIAEDLVLRGLDDWLDLSEVVWVVRSKTGVDGEQLRSATLEAIRQVLEAKLVTVGDLTTCNFVPWNSPTESSLKRIEAEWKTLNQRPGLGDVAWFSTTPAGDALAKQLKARGETA
jgi:hypothetical protein